MNQDVATMAPPPGLRRALLTYGLLVGELLAAGAPWLPPGWCASRHCRG